MLRRRNFEGPETAFPYLPAAYLTCPNGNRFNCSTLNGNYHRVRLTFKLSRLPEEGETIALAANVTPNCVWQLGVTGNYITMYEVFSTKTATIAWEELTVTAGTWYTVDYYAASSTTRSCSLNDGEAVVKNPTNTARASTQMERDVVIGSEGGEVSLRGEILFCGTGTQASGGIMNIASFDIGKATVGEPFSMTSGDFTLSGDTVVALGFERAL